jgi:hypothetical protein
MRGHEANTSLLNDNLAKKQTLRTEKLQGRAIKPVRLPRGTTELIKVKASDYVICDGPLARRHRVLGRMSEP